MNVSKMSVSSIFLSVFVSFLLLPFTAKETMSMKVDMIQVRITDFDRAAALSDVFYDMEKQIDLPGLRRMLNEGESGGNEGEGEDEEMDMDMGSTSDINIEAHDGMYTCSMQIQRSLESRKYSLL